MVSRFDIEPNAAGRAVPEVRSPARCRAVASPLGGSWCAPTNTSRDVRRSFPQPCGQVRRLYTNMAFSRNSSRSAIGERAVSRGSCGSTTGTPGQLSCPYLVVLSQTNGYRWRSRLSLGRRVFCGRSTLPEVGRVAQTRRDPARTRRDGARRQGCLPQGQSPSHPSRRARHYLRRCRFCRPVFQARPAGAAALAPGAGDRPAVP